MATNLHELLDSVKDESTFLAFASALRLDRIEEEAKEAESASNPYESGANGWENTTIEQFLGSAIAWAESTNVGLTQGLDPANPWRRFADFLYCGKIYE
jgi:hypothetical protein